MQGAAKMTEKEYNECVDRYADHLYRFIWKNLRHEQDAQDIVQSAFEKMWRNLSSVNPATAKSYLFTIAYHQMIDHLRRTKPLQSLDAEPTQEKFAELHVPDIRETLHEALNRLNEIQRSLVLLKDYEGYSYQEIGKITGLAESQVKVYLHRARTKLRQYLVKPENII